MLSKPMIFALGICVMLATAPGYSADSQGEANVQLIKDFLRDIRQVAMVEHDPVKVRAVVERYMTENYIQHAQDVAPGREGYIQGWLGRLGDMPKGKPSGPPKDLYFVGDTNFVVWMSEGPNPGSTDSTRSPPKYVFNMIRIVNGKMAEHWDSN